MRGATWRRRSGSACRVSTHAPHARGDAVSCSAGGTAARVSTHAPHARGDMAPAASALDKAIVSTHAPHARGHRRSTPRCSTGTSYNPRPSCEGRLCELAPPVPEPALFQPTPLMRGATRANLLTLHVLAVSTHAPHARGETLRVGTASARASVVSTHAPHARGDACESSDPPRTCGFNPRPSCEGRLSYDSNAENRPWFQPTPLMRGATRRRRRHDRAVLVSTHAPHARGDASPTARPPGSVAFQPPPLMRGATHADARFRGVDEVSTHAPHARGDF